MVELVCVAAFLACLYFWLIGHWFARVVVSIILVPVCAVIGAAILNAFCMKGYEGHLMAIVPGAIAGGFGGWMLAGAPVFYGRGWVWTERDDSEDASFNVTLRR